MIVLDLCGGTGAWSKPYREAGYQVINVTLPEYDIERWTDYNSIVDAIRSNTVVGVLAAPPCTMFSIARNDSTANDKRDLRAGMRTVNSCLEIIHEVLFEPFRKSENSLKFWALENPASGYLERFLGKPALVFEPFHYGDPYTKKTSLWGMFKAPKLSPVEATRGSMVSHAAQFKDLKYAEIPEGYRDKLGVDSRTIARSITPKGFAKAFFEANNPLKMKASK